MYWSCILQDCWTLFFHNKLVDTLGLSIQKIIFVNTDNFTSCFPTWKTFHFCLPFISFSCLISQWWSLYKLHGSANWCTERPDYSFRTLQTIILASGLKLQWFQRPSSPPLWNAELFRGVFLRMRDFFHWAVPAKCLLLTTAIQHCLDTQPSLCGSIPQAVIQDIMWPQLSQPS